MTIDALFTAAWDEHRAVAAATRDQVREPFGRLVTLALAAVRGGGKIVFFGNGGSAADAQHLATELVVRYSHDRPPIPAMALTTDTSALTAIGNDFGFDTLFARQVLALCRRGDLCIGLTTSGRSENVLQGLTAARSLGCVAAAFSGGSGGRLPGVADPLLLVPSCNTARIQEMHITLGHMLCAALEQAWIEGHG
jgi:D-sedoheptulose 7-phosphate isomerase